MSCIFINYRRADNAAGYSRSLAQSLRREFGEHQVFRDIKSIPPGQKFPEYIEQMLSSCRVMLVLIGTQWTHVTNARGERRLDNEDDWVRREVAAALERDILVIPVLVCGAQIPTAADLPADLAGLASRNAFVMSDDDWEHDLDQLVQVLRQQLDLPTPAPLPDSPPKSFYDVVSDAARRVPTFSAKRSRPGFLRRTVSTLLGWARLAVFIAIVVWIGYTQNDAFAAGVDRFFARSAEMLTQLFP